MDLLAVAISVAFETIKSLVQHRYILLQEAISKADKIVSDHQDYQKGLRTFDDWLQQEIEKLDCLELLDGNIEMYESTLQELQVS